jgi:hypothetical protein
MADHSQSGPFVQLSVFCEKVLEEKSGTISLVRVIDTWMTTAVGSTAPVQMAPIALNITYVLSLMAGAARGRHTITLELEEPTGLSRMLSQFDANFSAPSMGVNFVHNVSLICEHEGVYWVNALFGFPGEQASTLLSRTPLTVRYQRQV